MICLGRKKNFNNNNYEDVCRIAPATPVLLNIILACTEKKATNKRYDLEQRIYRKLNLEKDFFRFPGDKAACKKLGLGS